MGTLIIVEHDNSHIQASMHHVLSAAKALNEDIILLVVGHQCEAVATAAASLEGVHQVILADQACYAHVLPENTAALVVS